MEDIAVVEERKGAGLTDQETNQIVSSFFPEKKSYLSRIVDWVRSLYQR